VLWLLELLISNSQTSHFQCSLFSKKNKLSGFSAYLGGSSSQLNRISGRSTVLELLHNIFGPNSFSERCSVAL